MIIEGLRRYVPSARSVLMTVLILANTFFSSGCAAAWFVLGAGAAATAIAVVDDTPDSSENK